MVGFAVCRSQINTFSNATFPELEEMSDEDLKEFSSFMKMLRDSGMTREQKLEKVRVMLANESAEETVKEAIFKFYDLLWDVSLLEKAPAECIIGGRIFPLKIKAIAKPLSDSEKKELQQFAEISKKKVKELGIELPSQMTRKRR
ncbi:hypothetical protein ANCCAN_23803 [Ancylostoma caninum]|uniref:Uncharacterized protein n=1 Tax=Ancylostoma caninum TaxID=29170 RepID=A0A368FHY1_ANCCA|nr:hypothetical protein ANCCAN_23803 [Ancylostoma caninum]